MSIFSNLTGQVVEFDPHRPYHIFFAGKSLEFLSEQLGNTLLSCLVA